MSDSSYKYLSGIRVQLAPRTVTKQRSVLRSDYNFFSASHLPKEILEHLKMYSLNQILRGHVLSKQNK